MIDDRSIILAPSRSVFRYQYSQAQGVTLLSKLHRGQRIMAVKYCTCTLGESVFVHEKTYLTSFSHFVCQEFESFITTSQRVTSMLCSLFK